jgi:hypothetical protein
MFSTDVKVDLYPVVEQMKSEELLRVHFTVNAHKENGKTVLHKHIEGEDQYGNEKAVSVTLKTLMYAYLCNEFSPREDCDTAVIEVTLTLPGGYNFDDSGDYQADRRTASVAYRFSRGSII